MATLATHVLLADWVGLTICYATIYTVLNHPQVWMRNQLQFRASDYIAIM